LPCALSPSRSNTVHGFSIVTSLSRRLCSLHTILRRVPAHLIQHERASLQLHYDRGLGPVLQRDHAIVHLRVAMGRYVVLR
jgi:hypothetical protein